MTMIYEETKPLRSRATMIRIAAVAPTSFVSIGGSPDRLGSLLNGDSCIAGVTTHQVLAPSPSLSAPEGDLGSFGSGSPLEATPFLSYNVYIKGLSRFAELPVGNRVASAQRQINCDKRHIRRFLIAKEEDRV